MHSVFNLVDGNGEFSEAKVRSHSWFQLSSKFLPITYLDKNKYDSLFKNIDFFLKIGNINYFIKSQNNDKPNPIDDNSKKIKSINEYDFYQILRRFLFSKKNSENYLSILSQLAFCRCLQQAKILRYYLYDKLGKGIKEKLYFPECKENFNISNVQDNDIKDEYRKVVLEVFSEIEEMPSIYHLVFFTLLTKFDDRITNDDIISKIPEDCIQNKIKNLWLFTKEFVYGLKELASNIVNHSSEKEGIISGFVNINDELEIKIFDHGKVNIIEKFKNDNENQIKEITQRLNSYKNGKNEIDNLLLHIFLEDSKILSSNKFKFENFFNTHNGILLNQQAKRATAHIGLLFFKKLIENNNGQFVVVSHNETYQFPDSASMNISSGYGTSFTAILPLKKNAEYNPILNISKPKLSNKDNVENLNLLLKYNFVKIEDEKIQELILLENVLLYYRIVSVFGSESVEEDLFDFFLRKTQQKIKHEKIEYLQNKRDLVFIIDFEEIHSLNGSQLLRFIGLINLLFPKISIIIYNLKTELFFELTQVNKALYESSNLPYWNVDVFLLAYCYIENPNNNEINIIDKKSTINRFYFTDVLWGENPDQFKFISNVIRKNNYNAVFELTKSTDVYQKNPKKEIYFELPENILFFNRTNLLPFDLIIRHNEKDTLFEINSRYLLNKEICHIDILKDSDSRIHSTKLIKNLDELPGFKISGSHYRLGSKIHLEDFFYAKRYFQNSFFASRFAYLITEYLLKSLNCKNERQYPDEKLKDLTLLGYGIYSELLLSLVEILLRKSLQGNVKINHNIVSDTESMTIIKDIDYDRPNKNVIILVPIASTFSTSLKMEEYFYKYIDVYNIENYYSDKAKSIQSDKLNVNILQPHINLILVSDGQITLRSEPNYIEKKHGWIGFQHNVNIVKVRSFYNNVNRSQKYFLSLPSKWYSQNECVNCFPNFDKCKYLEVKCSDCIIIEKPKDCLLFEKALHYTDKTSVTPEELIGFPESKQIINPTNFTINTDCLIYRHSIRNNDCFQYHIIDERFHQLNLKEIEKWLAGVREIVFSKKKDVNTDNEYLIKETNSVLLFAPEHYSNTIFVNKVNEIVFLNSATILHYDVQNNNVSNFIAFYKELIKEYENIFFIDDTIITGGTIQKASDYIKYTKLDEDLKMRYPQNETEKEEKETNKKTNTKQSKVRNNFLFNGCFFLINRTTKNTNDVISSYVGNKDYIFSFANIHLPNAKAYGTKCQQCADFEKMDYLFKNSHLDRLKNHFFTRVLKLNKRATTEKPQKTKSTPLYNINQNLFKVELTHRLFDYFKEGKKRKENIEKFEQLNFQEWHEYFIKNSESPFKKIDVSKTNKVFPLTEEICVLLKVMALHPFILHEPIKNRIFYWTNWFLNEYISTIDFEGNNLSIQQFRDIKFLIRRAGLLKSNYLISYRFLDFITKFISNQGLKNLLVTNENTFYELQKKLKTLNVPNLYDNYILSLEKIKEVRNYIESIENFSTYLLAQIKEMLYKNEVRSIVVEERIAPLYKKETTPESRQLLRMILEENGSLIQSFWEQASKDLISQGVRPKENGIIEFNDESEAKIIIRKRQNIFYELKDFLFISDDIKQPEDKTITDIEIDEKLLIYLRIKTFLAIVDDKDRDNGSNIKSLNLNKKTHLLCKSVEGLFKSDKPDTKIGTFFIVKYREKDKDENDMTKYMFSAYNIGYAEDHVSLCLNENENYITQFIEGVTNKSIISEDKEINPDKISYNATIDSIYRDSSVSSEWKSDYAVPNLEKIKLDFFKDVNDVNNILILRFSEKTIKDEDETLKKEPLGAIILYSNNNIFSYQNNRYLLLLRHSISNFLSKHHKNDEFRDWYEVIEKSNFIKSFTHGVTTLDTTIRTTISNFNVLLKKNNLPTETTEILNVLFHLIDSKRIIVKFITDLKSGYTLKEASSENKISEIPYSCEKLMSKLDEMIKHIFNCVHPLYNQIPENYYKLSTTFTDDVSELRLYNKVLDDIIFEVFFNIRKVYSSKVDRDITIEKPIIITVTISKTHICFENNFFTYLDYPPNIPNLQGRIKRNDLSKGLNVINSISKLLYGKECNIEVIQDKFFINVPIK